jgi:hypothetical protein
LDAATLEPLTDNALDIGTTGKQFKKGYFANDVEVSDNTKGFIIKSPNGTRYRITVDNAGNLGTTPA